MMENIKRMPDFYPDWVATDVLDGDGERQKKRKNHFSKTKK